MGTHADVVINLDCDICALRQIEADSPGPATQADSPEVDALLDEWQRILDSTRYAITDQLRCHDELVKQFLRQSGAPCRQVSRNRTSDAPSKASSFADYKDTSRRPSAATIPEAEAISRETDRSPRPSSSIASVQVVDVWDSRDDTDAGNGKVTLWQDPPQGTGRPQLGRQASMVALSSRHMPNFEKEKPAPLIDIHQFKSGLKRHVLVAALNAVHWCQELKEPEREGMLASIADSKKFESLSATAILVNCIFTLWATNDAIFRVSTGKTGESVLSIAGELIFCTFFAFEIIIKLCVHRLYFFVNQDMGWNWLDFFLVVTSSMNLMLDHLLSAQSIKVSFLRSFRLLKITRILRMLRILKFCRKLRVMLDALIMSTQSLMWVIILLIVLFGIFSLLFVQLITPYIEDHYGEDCQEERCTSEMLVFYFGSVLRGVISLYMSTTGGLNWHILWELLAKTSAVNAAVFLLFTLVFYFCVFNLLTGMFVDQAVKAAQPDRDMVIFEQRSKEGAQIAELKRICLEFDDNGDGDISWDEFQTMIKNDKILFWLAAFGLDIADANMFFKMLLTAGEDDTVPIDTFVQGCMRMKGEATSIDLQALIFQVQTMSHKQNTFSEHVQSTLDALMKKSTALDHLAMRLAPDTKVLL